MRRSRGAGIVMRAAGTVWLWWSCGWAGAAQPVQPGGAGSSAATQPVLLDVGAPAPALKVAAWVHGPALDVRAPGPKALVVLFWATWSGPSRAALTELIELDEAYRGRGVEVLGITDEPAGEVRAFLDGFRRKIPFRLALDDAGATTEAYCSAAGVHFLPYVFLVGPERTIAWHGHPQQPELVQFLDQILSGTYAADQAREKVREARGLEHWENLFRESCAKGEWDRALSALDELLQAGAPPRRLLRYKLSILVGEVGDLEGARALVEQIKREYAQDARFLNAAAWDLVSETRRFERAPGLALDLAGSAYRADGGRSPEVLDTYARALYAIGCVERAIEIQSRAVERAREAERKRYTRVLAFYRRCKALQAEAEAP